MDYTALKTELQNDPQTLGYNYTAVCAPSLTPGDGNGNCQAPADLLNALTGNGTGTVTVTTTNPDGSTSTSTGSRAEVLFGAGTVISFMDIALAIGN